MLQRASGRVVAAVIVPCKARPSHGAGSGAARVRHVQLSLVALPVWKTHRCNGFDPAPPQTTARRWNSTEGSAGNANGGSNASGTKTAGATNSATIASTLAATTAPPSPRTGTSIPRFLATTTLLATTTAIGIVALCEEQPAFRKTFLGAAPQFIADDVRTLQPAYVEAKQAVIAGVAWVQGELQSKVQTSLRSPSVGIGRTLPEGSVSSMSSVSSDAKTSDVLSDAKTSNGNVPVRHAKPSIKLHTVDFTSLDDVSTYLAATADRLQSLAKALPASSSTAADIQALVAHVNEHRAKIRKVFAAARAEAQTAAQGVATPSTDSAAATADVETALRAQAAQFARDLDAKVEEVTRTVTAALEERIAKEKTDLDAAHQRDLIDKMGDQLAQLTVLHEHELRRQSDMLARQHRAQVQTLVDKERAGRLAKLDHLVLKLKVLERLTVDYGDRYHRARRTHQLWAGLHALLCTVDQSMLAATTGMAFRAPFRRELVAVKSVVADGGDGFVTAVLKTLPEGVEERGVASVAELKRAYQVVEDRVREKSLVPVEVTRSRVASAFSDLPAYSHIAYHHIHRAAWKLTPYPTSPPNSSSANTVSPPAQILNLFSHAHAIISMWRTTWMPPRGS